MKDLTAKAKGDSCGVINLLDMMSGEWSQEVSQMERTEMRAAAGAAQLISGLKQRLSLPR